MEFAVDSYFATGLMETDYKKAILLSEEIGKMLWSTIQKV